jgi:hypothetical protein
MVAHLHKAKAFLVGTRPNDIAQRFHSRFSFPLHSGVTHRDLQRSATSVTAYIERLLHLVAICATISSGNVKAAALRYRRELILTERDRINWPRQSTSGPFNFCEQRDQRVVERDGRMQAEARRAPRSAGASGSNDRPIFRSSISYLG